MSRHILLDWSGTVADDLRPVLAATNRIFEEFGKPPFSLEEFRRHFRLPFSGFYAEFLPEATAATLDSLYVRFFAGLQDEVTLLPGALDFLEFCRRTGRRVFLLSTIQHNYFEAQAARLGVRDFFERAYVEVMDKREKILGLLAENDLAPEETLFAGDMVHDIETARRGGVLSVAVLTGFDPGDKLLAADPDLVARDLGELARLLDGGEGAEERPVATVGALIFDHAGHVLMIRTHKWGGRWGIPGGKVRRGEASEDALRREVREETGLELGAVRFELVQDCIDSAEFMRAAHFLLLNYSARALPGEVRLNEEAQEWRWMPPDEALAMELNRPTRVLLEAVRRRGAP